MTGKNRENCDKSMKLGENTEFDMRNKIEYRPILGKNPCAIFQTGVLVPSTQNTLAW